MIVHFTQAYHKEADKFLLHNETLLSLKSRIREINEKLAEVESPQNLTLGILFIDAHFEPVAFRTLACLYTRHPQKDNEIAPCFLYFPYDAAELSANKQLMKEKIEAVRAELGWRG